MNSHIEVLTFDVESATQLSLIRNIGEKGINITLCFFNKWSLNYLSKYVVKKIRVPDWNNDEEQFMDVMIDVGKDNPKKYMILSCSDYINSLIVKYYHQLEKYFYFPFSDPLNIELLINKELFYKKMTMLDIKIPKTSFINSVEHVEELFCTAEYPVIVKPKTMFNKMFFQLFHTKVIKIHSLGEYYEYKTSLIQVYDSIIVQEFIEGPVFSIYGYYNNGFFSYCTFKRDYSDLFGTSVLGHSIESEELKLYAEQILSQIHYDGFAELEFIYDKQDQYYKLLEINSRPTQWCRLLKYAAKTVESIPLEMINSSNYYHTGESVEVKKDISIYYEGGLLELVKNKDLTFKEMTKCILRKNSVSMYYDKKDLIPSLKYRLQFIKSLIKWFVLYNKQGVFKYGSRNL
jgi:predicted ATP-grasp superfamily ATP-dependent carboligase